MLSKKKLFAFLEDIASEVDPKLAGVATEGLKHREISNETYGRKSMIYISWESPEARMIGEDRLEDEGFKVCRRYAPGWATSEVQVSFFKGYHWNE